MNLPPKKILLIDDEEDINRLIAKRLRSVGHDVHTLTQAEGALDVAREFAPDLVLLDISMPDVSGIDVFQDLRRNVLLKRVPVVFLSAHQDLENYCLDDLKADGFISKPFDSRELVGVIRRVLAGGTETPP